MIYMELINDQIVKRHQSLPKSYRNISNFFTLNPEQLLDLSWSGNPDVKFYSYVEQRDNIVPNKNTTLTVRYVVDHENHTVTGIVESHQKIPPTVSARQIRLWLLNNGMNLSLINQAISNIEDSNLRDSISVEWEYAPYIERNHPMLVPIAQTLGLNNEDIDRAFIEASNI